MENVSLFKGTFQKNQILAKVLAVIPIEKQIVSILGNRFPFFARTSQKRIMEKTFGPISISIPYHFYSPLLANRGCIVSLSSFGRSLASLDGDRNIRWKSQLYDESEDKNDDKKIILFIFSFPYFSTNPCYN